jgi:hypothetical protein
LASELPHCYVDLRLVVGMDLLIATNSGLPLNYFSLLSEGIWIELGTLYYFPLMQTFLLFCFPVTSFMDPEALSPLLSLEYTLSNMGDSKMVARGRKQKAGLL